MGPKFSRGPSLRGRDTRGPSLLHMKIKHQVNHQNIKKQRHHLLTKIHRAKAMDFPIVMYGCDSWTVKKAEH